MGERLKVKVFLYSLDVPRLKSRLRVSATRRGYESQLREFDHCEGDLGLFTGKFNRFAIRFELGILAEGFVEKADGAEYFPFQVIDHLGDEAIYFAGL